MSSPNPRLPFLHRWLPCWEQCRFCQRTGNNSQLTIKHWLSISIKPRALVPPALLQMPRITQVQGTGFVWVLPLAALPAIETAGKSKALRNFMHTKNSLGAVQMQETERFTSSRTYVHSDKLLLGARF